MLGEVLFRTLQPRRFGGGEADIAAFFDKQIEISANDMSTGWLAGVMGVLAFHLALFPAKAQTDVWDANPGALMACSYMQTGQDRLTREGYDIESEERSEGKERGLHVM